MSGDELREGMVGATIVICNDYEFELIRQKTGLGEADILERSEALIVTRGEHGSSVMTPAGRAEIAAVTPNRIVDPTGVGDAYRRRPAEGYRARSAVSGSRSARKRGGHLRAGAPGRAESRIHVARVHGAL